MGPEGLRLLALDVVSLAPISLPACGEDDLFLPYADDDIDGHLRIEGNRGIVFGDSPEDTVIDGYLELRRSPSTVRGVRVRGNVDFEGNEARLV